jgi:hypothetical protein
MKRGRARPAGNGDGLDTDLGIDERSLTGIRVTDKPRNKEPL